MSLTAAAVLGVGSLSLVSPASAATATGFTGGAGTFTAADGTLYAKQGAQLTLNVVDSDAKCAIVRSGQNEIVRDNAHSGSWTFSTGAWLTAGPGTGAVEYQVSTYNGAQCNGKVDVTKVSYTLDNTAPTATATLTPSPNAAGWNNSDVTLTWKGDDGSGSKVKILSPTSEKVTNEGTTTRTTTVTDNLNQTGTGSQVVRLDKTGPTINRSVTPAANAAGWNNTDVTVAFTASDATSGVSSVSPPTTLTANGSAQPVTGTATDVAGNSTSDTVSGVKIDKVAPTLSGKPTTDPDAAGWYRDDVEVAWTATDTLSGVEKAPSPSTITGEGRGLTAVSSVTDRAGNASGSVRSAPVSIDRTAPHTTVTAPPAWNNRDLTLSLVADDALSGVDKTRYVLDGGSPTTGTRVPVNAEGEHTLEFWSVDAAGNTEKAQTVSFGIDKTSPTIGHTQSPAANAAGWNSSDVTVTFDCSDAVSGVAECTGPQEVTDEGEHQVVTGTVRDHAGNTATDPATVSIDKTAPTITLDDLPEANADGWYSHPVTVTFTARDALSGIGSADASHTFGEGADQRATATATDNAGNSATLRTPAVNVDTTAPTLTGRVLEEPGADGWYDGDVTVRWSCQDNLSGVEDCPEDTVVDGEGNNLSATASVSDRAGNATTATVRGLRIDRHAPVTTISGVPAGWAGAPVALDLAVDDDLSGAGTTHYSVDGGEPQTGSTLTVGEQGSHTVDYWSVDAAGNVEDHQQAPVRIDLTAPQIVASQSPAQNARGWNNTDVTVAFGCQDQSDLSGLDECPDPQPVTSEGRAQQVRGTATDHAGNRATATATVNIDKTAPTLTGAPDRRPNGNGWYDDDVTVSFTGQDELSGIDQVTGPQHVGQGADQRVDGVAVDNAGNRTEASVTGLSVDETAPSLSGAPTTLPNENGWYDHDVTIDWVADDALSGLDGEAPADAVISGEGEGQTVSASVRDLAGNRTTAVSEPVAIDKTAPSTDVTAPGGWSREGVEVTLEPHDTLSGVASTAYRVDGGAEQHGRSLTLTEEGTHTVRYASTDKAGNVESWNEVTVRIDKTAPSIRHELDPQPNANGWNHEDVTVTFTCEDQAGLSGLESCTQPRKVTRETAGEDVTGTAVDQAGNSTTDTATVRLDRTPPVIHGERTPAANEHGWTNEDVTVHFEGSDELSGLDRVTPDRVLGEGTDQSVEGTASDAAGNTATTTVDGINVDRTAPTLRGAPTAAANGAGWYRGDVTIDWSADDDRSGVLDTPAASTIEGEGAGLTATATVSDKAGNTTTADSVPVRIDRTAPTTGADAPAGWSSSAVTVSLHASDGLSGVATTYATVDGGPRQETSTVVVDTEGVHAVEYWSVDEAGNVEAAHTAEVKVDLTRPTIGHSLTPAPNAAGWNNRPVTVEFSCDDALSGIASCPTPVEIDTDGEDQPVAGDAVDRAGNIRADSTTVSLDTVDPTITGAPDRAANRHGWYDDDVTVSFTCADALSGIAGCTAPQQVGQGRDQEVTGTAVDAADNEAGATVGPLHVDKTAPTLHGEVVGGPNGAGWFHGDVAVRWAADDALSGLDGPAPADSTITGEGTGLTVPESVRDLAGNTTTATSPAVKIDRTAPTTSVSDVSDWSNGSVDVDLTAGDNLSGVASTHYQFDDGDARTGTHLTIEDEGVHTLRVWSQDVAGNVEARQHVVVKIDRTAPGIAHTQSPAANARGWNNGDVTVTFRCTDGGSGIADCTEPVTRGEGGGQQVTGTATDKAGNTAPDVAVVNVDKTAPTVTGSLSAEPNAHGWFDEPVTATFSCADQAGLSGMLHCPEPTTLGEGRDQRAGGTATDVADNDSKPFAIDGIDVDTTRPTLDGRATTEPNENGWYRGDVTVRWTADDELSGIDQAPADSVVTGEGDDLGASTTVSDLAGNSRSATLGGLKIDRTAPSTTATAPDGWQSTDVTVRLSATDGLSGVAGTHYSVDGGEAHEGEVVTVDREGTHQVRYWSVDEAGNREDASSVTVLVDTTKPSITGAPTTQPNAAGWSKDPVTVHFTCTDALSGIASCQPDATVSAQGTSSVTGTAVDNAGNTGTTTVDGIRIDSVAPAVTIGGVTDGATYVLGSAPKATVSATDATSGLAGPATVSTTGGRANGVGSFTVTATATDQAGNTGTAEATYTVVYGYGDTLFLPPVNDTAHQTGVATSVFNAGQAVPMKFRLRNSAGTVVKAGPAPQWLTPVRGSSTKAAVNESAYDATASTGGSYALDGDQYSYNWKTEKSMAGYYWRVGVRLDDGQTYYVNVGLR